mgnify:CR=1 FL=1
MRDVTPNQKINIKELIDFLISFIKQPVTKITELPDWSWFSLLVVQILLALVSGFLAGLIKLNIYRVLFGIFIMPVVSTIAALLLAMFLYYYFQFFENRVESYRRLFTLVILSSIPFYLFQIISEYFAPVTLIGFAFTSLLGIIGLNENFKLTRKRSAQLVGVLFVLVLATWLMSFF